MTKEEIAIMSHQLASLTAERDYRIQRGAPVAAWIEEGIVSLERQLEDAKGDPEDNYTPDPDSDGLPWYVWCMVIGLFALSFVGIIRSCT